MEIHKNDLIIVPSDIDIPEDFPYDYHKIKHLHHPSIVISNRGLMTTTLMTQPHANTNTKGMLSRIFSALKLSSTKAKVEDRKDIFFRHIRIMNDKTGEFYHNRGASVLVDLKVNEGRFFFSFAVCNHLDNFNKLIAHCVCKERMEKGDYFECINYDPSISILQNIYLAVGVLEGKYPLTEFDWEGILPELYGTFTEEQLKNLSTLRRLIRDKAKD